MSVPLQRLNVHQQCYFYVSDDCFHVPFLVVLLCGGDGELILSHPYGDDAGESLQALLVVCGDGELLWLFGYHYYCEKRNKKE